MKKFLYIFLSVVTLCSINTLISYGQAETKESSAALLYEISGNGLEKPSYLFGTIHAVCPTDVFPMEKFNEYLNKTDQLILEIDMDNTDELQTMGSSIFLPEKKTLRNFLKPVQYAKVDEMFKNYLGSSVDNFATFKPTMLLVLITTSPKAMGCDQNVAYESLLTELAIKNKKGVEGLETVAQQIEFLDKTPFEKQAEELYQLALTTQKSMDDSKKLKEIYKTQNSEELYDFMKKVIEKDKDLQNNLLDNRNIDWIPKIEKAVKEKPSFIAVGAGHLGGEKGVLNLLKAKGYKLKPIRL